MSREIKFRAWDIDNKRMFKNCFELSKQGMVVWVQLEQLSSDNLVWEQFTGLKDKNGVDIYEEDTFNYRNNIFKCTFKGDRFGLEVLNQETCSGGEINKHYSLYLVSNIIEVIGNIRENKY